MSHPDTNEIIRDTTPYPPSAYDEYDWPGQREQHGWDGKCFDLEPTKVDVEIAWLRSENAYLRGKVEVYEKFLKDRGYIKEK